MVAQSGGDMRVLRQNKMIFYEDQTLQYSVCKQRMSTEKLRQYVKNDQGKFISYAMWSTIDYEKQSIEESEYVQSINKVNFQQQVWEHHWKCFKKGYQSRVTNSVLLGVWGGGPGMVFFVVVLRL